MRLCACCILAMLVILLTSACSRDPTASRATSPSLEQATKDLPFVNTIGLEFVPIPEKPGVWMCRTETRVQDFKRYTEKTGYQQVGGAYVMRINNTSDGGYTTAWELDEKASWKDPGFQQSGLHPVVCVSWKEAKAFCEWLNEVEPGKHYRLPTDSEWSVAVGLSQKYPWGNEWPPPIGSGNYLGSEGVRDRPGSWWPKVFEYDDGAPKTARVARYTESQLGFFDLGGNVSEWCEDSYKATMNDANILEELPYLKVETTSNGTSFKVVRGGSWSISSEVYVRSASRYRERPSFRLFNIGFRLVVEIDALRSDTVEKTDSEQNVAEQPSTRLQSKSK